MLFGIPVHPGREKKIKRHVKELRYSDGRLGLKCGDFAAKEALQIGVGLPASRLRYLAAADLSARYECFEQFAVFELHPDFQGFSGWCLDGTPAESVVSSIHVQSVADQCPCCQEITGLWFRR